MVCVVIFFERGLELYAGRTTGAEPSQEKLRDAVTGAWFINTETRGVS